jgi:hypothetical protein
MYTRLNQSFHTNRKIRAVGFEAAGAYCHLLSYCGSDHSDGEVPEALAEAIATPELLERLSEYDLLDHRDGYWIVSGYLDAGNPTCDDAREKRAANAERNRNHRRRQKEEKLNGHNGSTSESELEEHLRNAAPVK